MRIAKLILSRDPLRRLKRFIKVKELQPASRRRKGWDSKSLLHIVDHAALVYGNDEDTLQHPLSATRESFPLEDSIPRIPERFGRYELTAHLAAGGQASVYRGWDPILLRAVVIKAACARIDRRLLPVSRFAQEGALLAAIRHRGLVQIFDAGIEDGYAYLVMEFVPGQNLKQRFELVRPTARQCRDIILQIAEAMSVVHRSGILHLDLKPENVMLTDSGECRLIDFGVSWLLKKKVGPSLRLVAGTDHYMAPEQRCGNTAAWSKKTDTYGLGAILHFLLHGTSPVSECESSNFCQAPLPDSLRIGRCRLQKALQSICDRALATESDQRFLDAADFLNHVRQATDKALAGKFAVLTLASLAGMLMIKFCLLIE